MSESNTTVYIVELANSTDFKGLTPIINCVAIRKARASNHQTATPTQTFRHSKKVIDTDR